MIDRACSYKVAATSYQTRTPRCAGRCITRGFCLNGKSSGRAEESGQVVRA